MLVTFIPLNDRVEKQALGRTGRKGATGTCQIIVNREAMPEWSRSCETVDEVKRQRDSIEMHRMRDMNEVNLMRNKQKLFREYCELKKTIVRSNNSDSDNLKIQKEILDETWARWIQKNETTNHESDEMLQELRRIIGDCSDRGKQFESDNIYHIMKFGEVILMKGDFQGAAEFYDRVIHMDPDWSAFAHYNRSYCTIQMKGDGYIRRAIDDLKATLCKLETYKTSMLFSKIYVTSANSVQIYVNDTSTENTQYYNMMECQLLHHIDTQIIETIKKLETFDTTKGEMATVRRDILVLIPGVDCRTKQMLQEYRQMGLLFTYSIDEESEFRYMNQIMSSFVMLKIVADNILMAYLSSELLNGGFIELKDMIDAACHIGQIGDESFEWMSRCASRAIITWIHSIDFIRDVSFLVPIKQNELESIHKMTKETSQFTQLAISRRRNISDMLDFLKQKMKKLVSLQDYEISVSTTGVAMDVLRQNIQKIVHKSQLHRELSCCLYDSATSTSQSDIEQFVDSDLTSIRYLAQYSAISSQLSDSDFQTKELENIAVELMSKSRNISNTTQDLVRSTTSKITTAAAKINIGIVIKNSQNSYVEN